MGQDKATLRPVEGGPSLAQRVAAALQHVGVSSIHLVGRQPALHELGFPVVNDPAVATHHPLFGVGAALQHARAHASPSALLVPCDLPDLSVDALRQLAGTPAPAVATAGGHLQPLFAVLPVEAANAAIAAAHTGQSARRFVQDLGPALVPLEAASIQDVDTPEELATWSRSRRSSG